ncbi:MAG: hypothetical protein RLZZ602_1521, partial [Pseudomonadota bacterium]
MAIVQLSHPHQTGRLTSHLSASGDRVWSGRTGVFSLAFLEP